MQTQGLREARSAPTAAQIEIESGKLRGLAENGVYVFKGVPYGAETGGANRFLPPRPVAPWAGVRAVLDYGPRAPQNEQPSKLPHLAWIRDTRPYSGACLVLNVFTPGLAAEGKRPVMVYIHGGGYVSGAGSAPGIEGANRARTGDVVVARSITA